MAIWEKAIQNGVGIFGAYREDQNMRREASHKRDVELTELEINRQRSNAEAVGQQRALLSQMNITSDLKKWLGWSVAGLATLSSVIAVGNYFGRKRRAR